jgi:hypothetical protein
MTEVCNFLPDGFGNLVHYHPPPAFLAYALSQECLPTSDKISVFSHSRTVLKHEASFLEATAAEYCRVAGEIREDISYIEHLLAHREKCSAVHPSGSKGKVDVTLSV